jgi:hypothetical protein
MPQKKIYFLVVVIRKHSSEGLVFSRLALCDAENKLREEWPFGQQVASKPPAKWKWYEVLEAAVDALGLTYYLPDYRVEQDDTAKREHGSEVITNAHVIVLKEENATLIAAVRNFLASQLDSFIVSLTDLLRVIDAFRFEFENNRGFDKSFDELITQILLLHIPPVIPVGKSEWDIVPASKISAEKKK